MLLNFGNKKISDVSDFGQNLECSTDTCVSDLSIDSLETSNIAELETYAFLASVIAIDAKINQEREIRALTLENFCLIHIKLLTKKFLVIT